jgi:hypothetical protein
MATNEHGVRSKWFGAAVVLWAALGLLWAQVILLPNPLLPPPLFAELLGDIPSSTHPQRFIVMIFKATSLLLTGFALFGMFMAAAAEFAGARWSPLCCARRRSRSRWCRWCGRGRKPPPKAYRSRSPDTSLARWSLAR